TECVRCASATVLIPLRNVCSLRHGCRCPGHATTALPSPSTILHPPCRSTPPSSSRSRISDWTCVLLRLARSALFFLDSPVPWVYPPPIPPPFCSPGWIRHAPRPSPAPAPARPGPGGRPRAPPPPRSGRADRGLGQTLHPLPRQTPSPRPGAR